MRCVICENEFELKPNKPGYANRCPSCSPVSDASERVAGVTVWEGKHTPVLILTSRKDAREHNSRTRRGRVGPMSSLAPKRGFFDAE